MKLEGQLLKPSDRSGMEVVTHVAGDDILKEDNVRIVRRQAVRFSRCDNAKEADVGISRGAIFCLLIGIASLGLAGCDLDGEGLKWGNAVATDNTPTFPDDGGVVPDPDDGGNGGGGTPGGGGGGGGSVDRRFAGTWIGAFGDDLPQGAGRRQHAMRLVLNQTDASITGNGNMLRFFNQGSSAFDAQPFTVQVTGTGNGDDAVLNLSAGNEFNNNPLLWIRLTGSRLVVLYAERNPNLTLERSGHFLLHKVATTDIDQTWVAAFSDDFGAGGAFAARDRTGSVTLAASGDGTVGGLGAYVEQRPGDVVQVFDFDVVDGFLSGTQTELRFGNFSPANGEVDWFGYHSGSVIVAAYGQFNDTNQLVRFGHATWYDAEEPSPSDFERTWVTSFGDARGAGNLVSDYLMVMSGVSVNGNDVTGTVRVLDESEVSPAFANYTIENGSVVGNELVMDMVRTGRRFSWNLRLAGPVMVGSYQQFNSNDQFVSSGVAEWRFGPTSSLSGTYAASFFDSSTTSGTENRASQLAVITIGNVANDGTFTGTGSVRLAGEENRRQFALSGIVGSDNRIEIAWSGADLFGDTMWNLRKAGSYMLGTYTNFASNNQTVEFLGSATFLRGSS
jgi:hypothetical protein